MPRYELTETRLKRALNIKGLRDQTIRNIYNIPDNTPTNDFLIQQLQQEYPFFEYEDNYVILTNQIKQQIKNFNPLTDNIPQIYSLFFYNPFQGGRITINEPQNLRLENQRLRNQRQQGIQQWVPTQYYLHLNFTARFTGENRDFTQRIQINKGLTYQEMYRWRGETSIQQLIQQIATNEATQISERASYQVTFDQVIEPPPIQITTHQHIPRNLSTIRMFGTTFPIDKSEQEHWNTGRECCMIDFPVWHSKQFAKKSEKDRRGYKNLTEQQVIDIINSGLETPENLYETGISYNMLKILADHFQINTYLLDPQGNIIDRPQPGKVYDGHIPPYVLMYRDNHGYFITDQKSIDSIRHRTGKTFFKYTEEKQKEENLHYKDISWQVYDQNHIDAKTQQYKQLFQIFEKHQKIPTYSFQLKFQSGFVQKMILENTLYVFEPKDNQTGQIIKSYRENNGQKYNGENIQKLVQSILYDSRFSKLNPITKILNYYKNNQHQGYIKDPEFIKGNFQEGNYIVKLDINRAYTTIIKELISKWYFIDFHDQFIPFNQEHIKSPHGLFYVETEDISLFRGCGIYTTPLIIQGLKDNLISHKDIKYYLPIQSESSSYFKNLVEGYINDNTPQGETLKKHIYNNLAGMCGVSEITLKNGYVSGNVNDVFHFINKNIDQLQYYTWETYTHEEKEYFIYTIQKSYELIQSNIPIYHQITQQCNLLLYQLQRELKLEPFYRYVDSATFIVDQTFNLTRLNKKLSKWGFQVKIEATYQCIEEFQNSLNSTPHQEVPRDPLTEDEFILLTPQEELITNHPYSDSAQFQDIYNKVILKIPEYSGVFAQGSPGTGKTFLANKIMDQFDNDQISYQLLSPTNKALTNYSNRGGQTIHKYFGLGNDEKKNIRKYDYEKAGSLIEYLILEEVSMISYDQWYHIYNLQMYAPQGIRLILIGDINQCQPVNNPDKFVKPLLNPIIQKMFGFNYITLTKRYRYDQELGDLLDQVVKQDYSNITKKISQIDIFDEDNEEILDNSDIICYTNRTKDYINHKINYQYEGEEIMYKTLQQQNINNLKINHITIYEGLRVIMTEYSKSLNLIKNEFYWIKDYGDNVINLYDSQKQFIEITYNQFLQYFDLSYCMTTHRWQGQTCLNYVIITEIEKLQREYELIYTALSRATQLKKLYLFNVNL